MILLVGLFSKYCTTNKYYSVRQALQIVCPTAELKYFLSNKKYLSIISIIMQYFKRMRSLFHIFTKSFYLMYTQLCIIHTLYSVKFQLNIGLVQDLQPKVICIRTIKFCILHIFYYNYVNK